MTKFDRINVPLNAFDHVMPMHLILDLEGRITHAGPTIAKVLGPDCPIGQNVFSLFELRRPKKITSIRQVRQLVGTKVYLRLKDDAGLPVNATVTLLGAGEALLLNLSFGYKIVDAVARYDLSGSDFAPTDLTIELMYLVEAKTAAMSASHQAAERLQGQKSEAEAAALTDGLTGLANRRALELSLERMIETQAGFALMQIDLDFFKAVNDTLGHAAGDAVLEKVSQVLREETRETDVVARVGGDEFTILINRLPSADRLARIAERIIEKLERPIPFKDELCRISASIGIAQSDQYTPAELTIARIVEDADHALYGAKRNGRACFCIHGVAQSVHSPRQVVTSVDMGQGGQ